MGEPINLTLEAETFDALVELVKVEILKTLERDFGYVGEVVVAFQVKRVEYL